MKNTESRLLKIEKAVSSGLRSGIERMCQAASHYDTMRTLPEGSPERLREEKAWITLDPERFCETVYKRIIATAIRTAENKKIMQLVDWSRDAGEV